MLLKKKSLVVAFVSSIVIASVMSLTLVGYLVYIELNGGEFKRAYQATLDRINARYYSKFIEISKLSARIETSGSLRGKPILEGMITNRGHRDIADLLLKIKFVDRDGAVIYEVIFYPHEPSLGNTDLAQVNLSYIYSHPKVIIKNNLNLAFKRILTNCPGEILSEIRDGKGFAKEHGRWSGKLDTEIVSLKF